MNYFVELRQLVGHRPLLMVGATVLVLNGKDELLLLKRADNHCWGPPGGAMELCETLEDTARRETAEEAGLEVDELALFDVFSGPDLYYRYPSGDEVHIVTIVYVCRSFQGDIRLSDEHTDWGWFTIDDVPTDLSPPIKPVIEKFKVPVKK